MMYDTDQCHAHSNSLRCVCVCVCVCVCYIILHTPNVFNHFGEFLKLTSTPCNGCDCKPIHRMSITHLMEKTFNFRKRCKKKKK